MTSWVLVKTIRVRGFSWSNRGRQFLLLMLVLCKISLGQMATETRTLVVNGKSGEAAVVRLNGRTYVDLESLARIANGSLSFHGNTITLALSASSSGADTQQHEEQTSQNALSRDFTKAGIETLAQMREWASTMAYAIRNGYGVTEGWANEYRAKASNSLSIASAAASNDADRKALQLLTNTFESLGQWSDDLVEAKKSMDTAKYSTSPNALRDEPLSQKIINCGRFLSKMLGSGVFEDNPACN